MQATSDSLGARPEGNLVFMKEHETVYQKDKKALVLSVGGDTLAGIANQVQRRDSERPLALDLLWKVLSRGQEISKKDWRLVRVAIVDLRNNVYYGRLFFGERGGSDDKIVWDCDCRPSDACWLSIKAGCPIFIKQDVFDHHAVSIADLMSSAEEASAPAAMVTGVLSADGGAEELLDDSGTALLTRIRQNDPDQIKRLKREMEVALSEEDYVTAARIRDHPFMKLHLGIVRAQREGNHQVGLALGDCCAGAVVDDGDCFPLRRGACLWVVCVRPCAPTHLPHCVARNPCTPPPPTCHPQEAQALEEELSRAIEDSEERAGGKN